MPDKEIGLSCENATVINESDKLLSNAYRARKDKPSTEWTPIEVT